MARRILIEDFDEQTSSLAQAQSTPDRAPAIAALDGGAAPSSQSSGATGEGDTSTSPGAGDAIDAGGPPEWLTQAIGDTTSSSTYQATTNAYDAGPAPES